MLTVLISLAMVFSALAVLSIATQPAYAQTASGLFATPVSVTITSYFNVTDPNGALMTTTAAEYMPSSGVYTVYAYGLNPADTYSLTDSGASSSASVLSVAIGTYYASTGLFSSASNGTLIFRYTPMYSDTLSKGISETIKLSNATAGVPGYSGNSYGYRTIGKVTVSSPGYLANGGAGTGSQTFSASDLIPAGSTVCPGIGSEYNVYIGSTELTISGSTVVTASGSFTNPVLASGLYNLSIVYNGQAVSSAIFIEPVIISTSASSPVRLNSACSQFSWQ